MEAQERNHLIGGERLWLTSFNQPQVIFIHDIKSDTKKEKKRKIRSQPKQCDLRVKPCGGNIVYEEDVRIRKALDRCATRGKHEITRKTSTGLLNRRLLKSKIYRKSPKKSHLRVMLLWISAVCLHTPVLTLWGHVGAKESKLQPNHEPILESASGGDR